MYNTSTLRAIEIKLEAVSPVSFMAARIGDKLRIRRTTPKKNEYRDKIGPATESYLVFKGETKIGMIPATFTGVINELPAVKYCRVVKCDQDRSIFIVSVETQNTVL